MVGIVDGASQLDDGTPLIFISPALLTENIGLSETLMNVDLRPGVDLPKLRAELDADPALAALSLEQGTLISQPVRNAVQAQASGLWILAVVAAIAAIAVLGQVMTRQVRPTQEERERLSAIGFTKSQILAEASARGGHPHHDRLAAGRGGGGPWLRISFRSGSSASSSRIPAFVWIGSSCSLAPRHSSWL